MQKLPSKLIAQAFLKKYLLKDQVHQNALCIKNMVYKMSFAFSYENHGRKMYSDSMTRHFNRFRYDEYQSLKDSQFKLALQSKHEKKNFQNVLKQFEKDEFQKFFEKSSKRQDRRSSELPERYDNYEYYTQFARMGEFNDYLIVMRRELGDKSKQIEEKVIDLLEIGVVRRSHQNTAHLTKMSFSDCHRYIAVGVDLKNDEHQTFFIKDVKSNVFLNDRLEDVFNVKFSKCGNYLYYVKQDDRLWSNAIYKHKIGSEMSKDELIYQEKDESFYLELMQSKDKKYLFIDCRSKANSEIHALDRETGEIKCLVKRSDNCKAFLNHVNDKFFALVNKDLKTKENCYDFKVITMSQASPSSKGYNIQDFYIPEEGEVIREIDIFEDCLVLYIYKEGSVYMRVVDLNNPQSNYKISLGDEYLAGTSISPGLNENLKTETFRFHVDTPFVYNQVFDFDFKKKKSILLQDFELDGPQFKKNNYISEIVYANSKDGVTIPITILRAKKFQKNRQNKLLLHGYGSYGVNLDIGFSINYLSALEEGWTLAFAHVRGGGERGQKWHQDAILDKKPNSFYDFISCAEYLVAEGYTHPSLMCAYGASAGGVLVGAVMNMRPELFKACILNYPFLDVLTSLLDKNQALSASDYDDFGNPLEYQYYYDLISSYSPYENIQLDAEYPAVYITCGSNDYRAPLWNVLKYVNRFRDRVQTPTRTKEFCPKNIVVNVLDSGHSGEQGVIHGIKEKALYLAFLEYVVTKCNNDIKVEEI
ncbi:peptidase S9A prolyl oligopeptidase domain protein beta-propeller (macronuclear) [Tetrahymena thermophila SB210]|uniref:Prolyl endopeptidase n=1 Tax=Tetrahymena thermophila (strain SB210) TaxID=312017 RepID=Q246D1_TETTS|nr:peptidase S9A prolyl oligopeptidase domain protein beta-propeller [Tetrahymena thermophila SB210]EAS03452.2 peptidase S9A prolyl oligopeptidase domain protein beta-propeller [Tetrahymena thermophila SB210]|eukprot:XP_001023697.2 peptidase S9A prolyl oligopeptidase domain protein beta-propeller [Tetrahymena thermophila SB210]